MNSLGKYLFAGLLALGLCLIICVKNNKSYDRTVSVKGLCEREVMATNVIWPIQYNLLGNNLPAIYEEFDKKNEIIVNFLKENGIEESDISIAPPRITDRSADQYSENKSPYRYYASSVVTVSSTNVEVVRKCIAKQIELLKLGVVLENNEYSYGNKVTSYTFQALNDIKPEMIEEATKNARAAAEKFAKDSRSRIGKIKRANQGVFSVVDRDANTPYIKIVRVVTSVEYYLK